MSDTRLQPDISLITPMYNESDCIQENIERIIGALEGLQISWEYILVDDGSKDESYQKAQETIGKNPNCRIIHYPINRGRGFALRQGFAAANGRFVITTESDLSWGAGIVRSLYEALQKKGSDIVIASVHLPGGGLENVPLFRRLLTSWGNKVLRWSFGTNLTMLSGMTRGYRREAIQSLYLEENRKEIHLEIVTKAMELGFRISEIPATITWSDPQTDQPKRGGLGIAKFIIPHLLTSLDRAAFKTFMWISFTFFIIGLGLSGFGTINKFYYITATPKPNLIIYGLVFILMAIICSLFAGISLQLNNIYKSMVHLQSQLKRLRKNDPT
jgi:glycosyltransferase involved in cell wall biosynthesis